MIDQTMEPAPAPPTIHYDFRGGRWWECDQNDDDGKHYFVLAADR